MKQQKFKGALELNWINKEKSLLYEIDEEEGRGIKPVWVDKGDIRVSEPRNLKLVKEYGNPDNENMLIKGDNLLALKTLVEMFKNREEKDKVKCIYIDPPFNTGNAFEHYEDNLEHSQWLTMMRDRLTLLKKLMRRDGIIFIHLDDRELAHCKLVIDEIFGHNNFKNVVTMTTNAPSGFKATGKKLFSTSNYLLIYTRTSEAELNQLFIEKEFDWAYSKYLLNSEDDYKKWKWETLTQVVAEDLGFKDKTEATLRLDKESFNTEIVNFALKHAENVFRTAAIGGGARIKRMDTIELSKENRNEVFVHPNEDVDGFYILNGEQILFYENRLVEIDGMKLPGTIVTDVWNDISWTGIANEGKVKFKNSKKPEKLIRRILDLSTEPGDLVLDSFLGSGTTVAVAHKMGRRWIGIEIGNHAETHCIPRLKIVLNGKDKTGISKDVNWKGGSGFRYYVVGASLILKSDMNWNLTYEEIAKALFMMFDYIFVKKLDEEIYIGKRKEKYALSIASKDVAIIKSKELEDIVTKVKETYNNVAELEIYTNKGVGVKEGDLPAGLAIKKIPESVLRKYKL